MHSDYEIKCLGLKMVKSKKETSKQSQSQESLQKANNANGYFRTLFSIYSPSVFFLIIAFSVALLFSLRLLRNNINIPAWTIITIIIGIMIATVSIIYTKPHRNLYSRSVTYFDLFLLSFSVAFLISTILCFPCLKLLSMESYLPAYVLSVFMFVCFGLMIIRIICVNCSNKNNKKNYYTISDLLCYDNFPLQKEKCILKDIPVNEDLLHREYIVNRLISAISGLESGGSIAVHGKWGAGKTSLIKHVLDQYMAAISYEILDVWNYSDEKALLTSIIDTIYKNLGIGKDSAIIKSYLKKYVSVFLSSANASFLSNLLEYPSRDNSIISIINNYLVRNNKRTIIVLDNLDRATDEFVMMVYKTVAHLSKLKNVIFICAFDDKRTSEVLNRQHLPNDYLDKLFTITIKVPNPNCYDMYPILSLCLQNYFKHYFKEDYAKLDSTDRKIVRLVINCCDNLRTFILLFNSLSNLLSMNEEKINIADALAVELFKIACPSLISLIVSNSHFFVICHRDYLEYDINPLSDKSQLVTEKKEFVNHNFAFGSPHYKYFDLLNLLFPDFSSFIPGDTISFSTKKRAVEGKRIYSGKYFSMYFEEKETKFELLQEDLTQALTRDGKPAFYRDLDCIFQTHPRSYHPQILRHIQEMENIDELQKEYLLWYLLERYYWFSDYLYSGVHSAKRMAVNIICDLLNDSGYNNQLRFFKKYNENSLEHIVLMKKISRELFRRAEQENEDYDPVLSARLEDYIKKACYQATDIDNLPKIYSQQYYDLGVTQVLVQYEGERFMECLGAGGYNVPNNCFIPIVNDFITTSFDSDYVYYEANLGELEKICHLPDLANHLNGFISRSNNDIIIRKIFSNAYSGWNRTVDNDYEPYLKYPFDDPPSFHDDLLRRSELVRLYRVFES